MQNSTESNPVILQVKHGSKCCLNRDCMLHMLFKLRHCPEKRWRSLLGFDYLAKLIEGIQFSDGIKVIPEIRIAALLKLLKHHF